MFVNLLNLEFILDLKLFWKFINYVEFIMKRNLGFDDK